MLDTIKLMSLIGKPYLVMIASNDNVKPSFSKVAWREGIELPLDMNGRLK